PVIPLPILLLAQKLNCEALTGEEKDCFMLPGPGSPRSKDCFPKNVSFCVRILLPLIRVQNTGTLFDPLGAVASKSQFNILFGKTNHYFLFSLIHQSSI